MTKLKPYNYKQTSMVVINYEEQLQAGTFEYAVHHLIDNKLDLSIFYPNYKNDSDMGGKAKVDTQWKLYCMVHNIEKLANYGNITA